MDVRSQITGDLIGRDAGEVGTGERTRGPTTAGYCALAPPSALACRLLPCSFCHSRLKGKNIASKIYNAAVDHILKAPEAACEGLVSCVAQPTSQRAVCWPRRAGSCISAICRLPGTAWNRTPN